MPRRLTLPCVLLLALPALAQQPLPLEFLKLPDGFHIAIFAENLPNARSLARGDKGTLFVSTLAKGNVYAVTDDNADGKADRTQLLLSQRDTPNGVAFANGTLYIAERNRILRLDNIEDRLEAPPAPEIVLDNIPSGEGHYWKYLALGPDGLLYFNMGAPCNICNNETAEPRHATIMRVAADGTNFSIFARGVRNSVGFTWHPHTREMWFTDNGRDLLGDEMPPCELNRAPEPGLHFGYPYCHGGDLPDPEFGQERPCDEFVPPVQKLVPHCAPLGLKFYTGDMFPPEYRNQLLIAEHGSWNRSKGRETGYRVSLVRLDESGQPRAYEDFITGWIQRTRAWGRPVDLLVLPDGSLLISDDAAGVLYRVTYAP